MTRVLVLGGDGQVGLALQAIAEQYPSFEFIFTNRASCDILNFEQCKATVQSYQPLYCINLAAYTAVDLAEEASDMAYAVNAEGVRNLAKACLLVDACLIQLSTDFVFDGNQQQPYKPSDQTNPLSIYGLSKLGGEKYVKAIATKYYIVRTSWVYSDFGHNFKQTMLRLAKERTQLSVVDDQIGCPTEALELVEFLVQLIQKKPPFGTYHFCGDEVHSWFSFALSIFEKQKIDIQVLPISSEEYPTKAIRPKYSVLEKSKI